MNSSEPDEAEKAAREAAKAERRRRKEEGRHDRMKALQLQILAQQKEALVEAA